MTSKILSLAREESYTIFPAHEEPFLHFGIFNREYFGFYHPEILHLPHIRKKSMNFFLGLITRWYPGQWIYWQGSSSCSFPYQRIARHFFLSPLDVVIFLPLTIIPSFDKDSALVTNVTGPKTSAVPNGTLSNPSYRTVLRLIAVIAD